MSAYDRLCTNCEVRGWRVAITAQAPYGLRMAGVQVAGIEVRGVKMAGGRETLAQAPLSGPDQSDLDTAAVQVAQALLEAGLIR
jgi:hypothetical protein